MSLRILFVILVLCLLAPAAHARMFICPNPVELPATLNLQNNNPGTLKPVQTYINNLEKITKIYQTKRRKPQKNALAHCLMGYLASLPDNRSLLNPASAEDEATLKLLREEVEASLALTKPYYPIHAQLPYIEAWLEATPTRR